MIDGAAGVTTFNDLVGDTFALSNLTTNANGSTVLNTSGVNGAVLDFNDDVVIGQNSTLTGSTSIDFAGTVNSEDLEANSLTLNSPVTAFHGAVGQGNGVLGTLTTDAAGTTTIDTTAVNGAVLDFNDDVVIGQNTALTGSTSIDFAKTVNSEAGEANDLALNSPLTALHGAVGGQPNGALGDLTTDAAGTTHISGGGITTTGKQTFNDKVILEANTELQTGGGVEFFDTIDGNFLLKILGTGDAVFHGNIGQSQALASFQTFIEFNGATNIGVVKFVGNDFRITVTGDIVFNGALGFVPTVATIGSTGNLTIVSLLNGSFSMGQNQKMTVQGDLLLSGALDPGLPLGGHPMFSATLGDVNTLRNMTINAERIFILTRPQGTVLGLNGVLAGDLGVDFVAGGRFRFRTTPVLLGGFGVHFANPDAQGDALGTLRNFVMQAFGAVTPDQLFEAVTILDLRAQGPTNTNVGQSIAAAIPRESELEDVAQDLAIGAIQRRELIEKLGIAARDLQRSDLIQLSGGPAVINDFRRINIINPGLPQVLVTRLQRSLAVQALATYDRLISAGGDTAQIRSGLESAYDDYLTETGEDADPAGFADYLARTGRGDVLQQLQLLGQLLRDIRIMGAAPKELEASIRLFDSSFRPPNIPTFAAFERSLEAATQAGTVAGRIPRPAKSQVSLRPSPVMGG
jgi:hypothetical protein